MRQPDQIQLTALSITRAVGSPASIFIHTVLFLGSFAAAFSGFIEFDRMLLILTTIVSLEAIYLAIFIQMTINFQGQAIAEVEQNIDEIQEDVEEIQEDIDEVQKDVDEIQEDVEEISEEVEEIGDDVEEISEDEDAEQTAEEARKAEQAKVLGAIHADLQRLITDIDKLKKERGQN